MSVKKICHIDVNGQKELTQICEKFLRKWKSKPEGNDQKSLATYERTSASRTG